ncbi:unnamed protein product [Arctogadus glacialis]
MPTLGFNLRNAWKGMGKEWEMPEKPLATIRLNLAPEHPSDQSEVGRVQQNVPLSCRPFTPQAVECGSSLLRDIGYNLTVALHDGLGPESNSSSCHCLGVECRVQPPSFEVAVDDAAGHAPRRPLE